MLPVYILGSPSDNIKRSLCTSTFKPIDFKSSDVILEIEDVHETYCKEYKDIVDILQLSKDNDPTLECIIIKNDNTTTIPPKALASYIKNILNRNDYDIFYLAYYLDSCHKYNESEVLARNIRINRTYSPGGLQAIIIKPNLRDIILKSKTMKDGKYLEFDSESKSLSLLIGENIKCGNIIAKNTYPPLMSFDVIHSKCNEDYLKSDPCKTVTNIKPNSYIKWIVLLIIFILLLFVVVALFLIQRSKK